jgi:hypothetical protein
MPSELTMLLSELSKKLRTESKTASPEVILINGVEGSVHGIALAGWLLEYDVVYYIEDANSDASRNNLAGLPLILIIVKVDSHTLYQYTFPIFVADAVCRSMAIKGSSIQDICQAIKIRLAKRIEGSIEVSFQHITMDRVAL